MRRGSKYWWISVEWMLKIIERVSGQNCESGLMKKGSRHSSVWRKSRERVVEYLFVVRLPYVCDCNICVWRRASCNAGTLPLCPPTMSFSQGPLRPAVGPALLPQQLARANQPITEPLAQPTRDLLYSYSTESTQSLCAPSKKTVLRALLTGSMTDVRTFPK